MDKRIFITKDQAIKIMAKGRNVHTFRNPSGMLLGCDISRKEILIMIENSGEKDLEIGGDTCKRLKHALVINIDGLLFVETDMDKVATIDK